MKRGVFPSGGARRGCDLAVGWPIPISALAVRRRRWSGLLMRRPFPIGVIKW